MAADPVALSAALASLDERDGRLTSVEAREVEAHKRARDAGRAIRRLVESTDEDVPAHVANEIADAAEQIAAHRRALLARTLAELAERRRALEADERAARALAKQVHEEETRAARRRALEASGIVGEPPRGNLTGAVAALRASGHTNECILGLLSVALPCHCALRDRFKAAT